MTTNQSPAFECGLDLMANFQQVEYEKGKILTLHWRNMADTLIK